MYQMHRPAGKRSTVVSFAVECATVRDKKKDEGQDCVQNVECRLGNLEVGNGSEIDVWFGFGTREG